MSEKRINERSKVPGHLLLLAAGFALTLGLLGLGCADPPSGPQEGELRTKSVDGMKFRFIPPGTFQMGSPTTEDGRDDDEIQHEVELTRGFWIGETEVTQGQWEKLVGNNPSRFKACGENCPVEEVSWFDAVRFANLLSQETGLESCYELDCTGTLGERGSTCDKVTFQGPECNGYRLPTEAEWEYAARAGTGAAYYAQELNEIAWFSGNSDGSTHPVGDKKANDWHLNDMLGNVSEWCGDAYGPYPDVRQDPLQSEGSARVFRGGSWGGAAQGVRAACRVWLDPGVRDGALGFRLARGQEE